MQIELIGCTSAGKSTLARNMVRNCRQQGLDVILAEEFVLGQLRLQWVHSRLLRKLVVNFAGLFASLVTWRSNGELNLFATQVLFQLPISPIERVGLLRNVLKKVGIGEIVRARSTGQQIILIDEGVLQIAHNLFVHVSAKPAIEAIATFVSLVPLPDVVVYVRPDESILIERTLQRGHSRIAECSDDNVASFINRAVTTFDRLVEDPAVESKLLVVDGAQRLTCLADDQGNPVLALASGLLQTVGVTGQDVA